MSMICTEDFNNEIMRMNSASIPSDKYKKLKSISFSEECFKLCSYENGGNVVKGVLNHKKRKYFAEYNRKHYHLQKRACSIHEYLKIYVAFRTNTKKHGLFFQYKMVSDNLLGIVYVAVRRI